MNAEQALSEVLDASHAYARAYEARLTFVVCDEDYLQVIRDQVPFDASMAQSRRMRSEVYFVFTPKTTWMAIRDVLSVDGQSIGDRPHLLTMLGTTAPAQVDATIKEWNSRFNIGRTLRNFNEPTLALEVLDANREAATDFRLANTRTDHGTSLATLAFREHGPETLIHDLRQRPAPSTGEILVEVSTGRVRRTQISTHIDEVSMTLTTDYTLDHALDLWVPSALREHYEAGVYGSGADSRVPGTGHEEITCEARYSHFRRFEVTGRIKNGIN